MGNTDIICWFRPDKSGMKVDSEDMRPQDAGCSSLVPDVTIIMEA